MSPLTTYRISTELDGKRQEILIEAVRGLRRTVVLTDSATATLRQLQALQDAARTRNVELSIQQIARPDEIAAAIDAAKAWGADWHNSRTRPPREEDSNGARQR